MTPISVLSPRQPSLLGYLAWTILIRKVSVRPAAFVAICGEGDPCRSLEQGTQFDASNRKPTHRGASRDHPHLHMRLLSLLLVFRVITTTHSLSTSIFSRCLHPTHILNLFKQSTTGPLHQGGQQPSPIRAQRQASAVRYVRRMIIFARFSATIRMLVASTRSSLHLSASPTITSLHR